METSVNVVKALVATLASVTTPATPVAPVAPAAAAASAASAASVAGPSVDVSLFTCPISHEPMVDPVFTADGNTYDREHIEDCTDVLLIVNPKLRPLLVRANILFMR